jgi:hypothetical protein
MANMKRHWEEKHNKEIDELTEYLQGQHTGVTRESVENMLNWIFTRAEEKEAQAKDVQE